MVLIILATALIVLVWPALVLRRSVQVQRIYSSETAMVRPVTAKHVAALRELRFAWSSLIEGGGPIVDPWTPYGSENMADDLGPIIDTRDPVSIAQFHREVSSILIEMLRTCPLPPGRYRLAHLNNDRMEQRLRSDLAGLPAARVEAVVAELPRLAPDGHFHFTEQHRRLLQRIAIKWPDLELLSLVMSRRHPAPVVAFKRPFGEMTAFEIDMAAILGQPRPTSGAIDVALAQLYWEMWPALQTFVEHAPIEKCSQ